MNLQELRKLIREEIQLAETGRTGLPGLVEKDINIALRDKYREDNINYGGCGIMAELLYYACKKHLSVTPKIIVLTAGFNKSLNQLSKLDVNKAPYPALVDMYNFNIVHVVLQFPGTNVCLDSDGFHSLNYLVNHYGELCINPVYKGVAGLTTNDTATIQTLTKWVRNRGLWNDTFSRARIPNLAQEVYELVSKAAAIPALKNKITPEA